MVGTPQTRWDYALYLDWCAATGIDKAATTVDHLAEFAAFMVGADSTGRRRLRNVLRHLAEAGIPVPVPDDASSPLWTDGEGLASLDGTLSAISVRGWPGGLRGSRDATVVVAAALGGFTRSALCALSVPDLAVASGVARIGSVELQPRADPRSCPSCVVANWLNTYGLASDFPGKARERVMLRPGRRTAHQHQLLDAARLPRWAAAFPSISRSGDINTNTPVGPRTITRIIAARRQGIEEESEAADSGRAPSMYADLSWDEVDLLLDEVCARADEALAKATAAMASVGTTHHRTERRP